MDSTKFFNINSTNCAQQFEEFGCNLEALIDNENLFGGNNQHKLKAINEKQKLFSVSKREKLKAIIERNNLFGDSYQEKVVDDKSFDELFDDIITSINEENQRNASKYAVVEPQVIPALDNNQLGEKKYESFKELFEDFAEIIKADNELTDDAIVENPVVETENVENEAVDFFTKKNYKKKINKYNSINKIPKNNASKVGLAKAWQPTLPQYQPDTLSSNCSSVGTYYIPKENNYKSDAKSSKRYNSKVNYIGSGCQNNLQNDSTEPEYYDLEQYYLPVENQNVSVQNETELNYLDFGIYYDPNEAPDHLPNFAKQLNAQNLNAENLTQLSYINLGSYYTYDGVKDQSQQSESIAEINSDQFEEYYLLPENQTKQLEIPSELTCINLEPYIVPDENQLCNETGGMNYNEVGTYYLTPENKNIVSENTRELGYLNIDSNSESTGKKNKINVTYKFPIGNQNVPRDRKHCVPLNKNVAHLQELRESDPTVLKKTNENRVNLGQTIKNILESIGYGKLSEFADVDISRFNNKSKDKNSCNNDKANEMSALYANKNLISSLDDQPSMASTVNYSNQINSTNVETPTSKEETNFVSKPLNSEFFKKHNIQLPIVVDEVKYPGLWHLNCAQLKPKKQSKAGRKPNPNSKKKIELALRKTVLKDTKRLPVQPLTAEDKEEMQKLSCLSPYGMRLEIQRVHDEAVALSKIENFELTKAKNLKALYFFRRRRKKPNEPRRKYIKRKKVSQQEEE